MSASTIITLAAVFGLAACIVLYVMVLPKKKDGQLQNKYLQFIHDYFHFKTLYLEVILKFIFTLATCLVVFYGFFTLFGEDYWGDSTFGTGLVILIAGPLALRIAYESIMMFILLVKNVIDINNKTKAPCCEEAKEEPKEPVLRFCADCGTQYDANVTDTCPKCGKKF